MRTIDINALKTAGSTSSSWPVSLNVDGELLTTAIEKGIARTTNPTAVSDTGTVQASFDDVGRQVVTLLQVRDLIATASATLSTGTAATLLAAGGSGVFHDLVHLTASNNSTVAGNTASVQLLQDGSVVKTLQVPNGGTLAIDFTVPIPQGSSNTVWTVDMEDITGTTVYIDALFAKNV